jgi:type II secretory pathway pseudopilin PulG
MQLRGQAGYAMAALLVAMSVMMIMMSVAMPVWKQASQREKEEELVFRGEQYARAIGLFKRKYANANPPTIDVLVQERLLRKKYKDPITNDDFVPLTMTTAGQTGRISGSGSSTPGAISPSQGPTTAPAPGRSGGPGASPIGPQTAAGGIIGVTSKSKATSIRLYKGRNHYNEWAFVYTPPAQTPGAGAPGAVAPGGQRGQPQRGAPNSPFTSPFGSPGRGAQPPGGRGSTGPFVPQPPNSPRGRF